MRSPYYFRVAAVCAVVSSTQPNVAHAAIAAVEGIKINVQSVVRFKTPHGVPIYQFDVKYDADRDFVLNGLPRGSGVDTFTFLASEPNINLNWAGSELGGRTLRFSNDVAVAAGSPIKDVPDVGDFNPPNLYAVPNMNETETEQRVLAVVNEYYPSGVHPLSFTKPYRLVSYCRALDDVAVPRRGKIALLVEFPVEAIDRKTTAFRLSWVAYESRLASSEWPKATSPEVTSAAEKFMRQFIAKIVK